MDNIAQPNPNQNQQKLIRSDTIFIGVISLLSIIISIITPGIFESQKDVEGIILLGACFVIYQFPLYFFMLPIIIYFKNKNDNLVERFYAIPYLLQAVYFLVVSIMFISIPKKGFDQILCSPSDFPLFALLLFFALLFLLYALVILLRKSKVLRYSILLFVVLTILSILLSSAASNFSSTYLENNSLKCSTPENLKE